MCLKNGISTKPFGIDLISIPSLPMSRRTSLKLTDERERQLEKASEIVASSSDDDPPMSVVINSALAHGGE